MFQLDFQLKEEVGDTGTYVMNGEWALLGKTIRPQHPQTVRETTSTFRLF